MPESEPDLTGPVSTTKSARKRRPVFFGWYIVAASVATNTIFSAAYFQGFGVLVLPIERAFGWDRWVISAAMSLRQLEAGILSPAVGFLLDRISARKLIFWSAVISGVGFIGLGFTTGVVGFFLFFALISLGASGVSHGVTWPVIISRWFRRNRGLAIGLAVTGPIFGSPIVILNAQIEQAYGWRAVLIGYGIIVLGGVTLLSMLVRDRPEPYGFGPDGDPPQESAAAALAGGAPRRRPDAGLTFHAVLRTKEFWLFTIYLAGTFTVNSAFQLHMIPYFQQDLGHSPAWAAVIASMVFIISGIGRIGGGHLLDKIDYRVVLAVVAAMMGFALAYLQLVSPDTIWSTLPFALLFGVSFGCLVPMRGAVAGTMFGTLAIGKVLGLLQGGPVAAGVIGPLAMGLIFDLNGSYSVGLWVLIAISALMVPLPLVMASPAALAGRIGRS
ncbi:MAG TPA: MFS transporter [Candidatus Acidoferrales bacterium]|nr:MFS transporter [Candidatus Acidoferrales bacterium]